MIASFIVFLLICGAFGGICNMFSDDKSSKPQWSAETLRKSETLKERMATKSTTGPWGIETKSHVSDPKTWASAR